MTYQNPPINYFGGKGKLLSWLLPFFPPHKIYIEPFLGGGTVFLNKPRSPIEIINDLDGEVINVYRVLQNPETRDRFLDLASLTPCHRTVFEDALASDPAHLDAVERAHRYLILVGQSYGACRRDWSYSQTLVRRGMSATVSVWLNRIRALPVMMERLQTTQIECDDFRAIIKRYQSPVALIYCDPPYVHATRTRDGYKHEMTDDDHRELVKLLLDTEAMVVLSGYAHPIYLPLEAAGWTRHDKAVVSHMTTRRVNKTGRPPRMESLWINPAAKSKSAGVVTQTRLQL